MWHDLKLAVAQFFETNRAKKLGFVIGLASGAAILTFGLFNTLFALGCGVVGLYVGSKVDGTDGVVERALEHIDRIMYDKFRR